MTKAQYIDYIRNLLSQPDETAKYHRAQVALVLEKAISQVYYDMAKSGNPKELERYTIEETSRTVTANGTTGLYETTLTNQYVNLPRKSSGVYNINSNTGKTVKYVPLSVIEMEQIADLECALGGNVIGYAVAGGKKIVYYNMDATTASAGVRVRYIPVFSSYTSTDEVILPYGQDTKILDYVREALAGIPPRDFVNDNADHNG